MEGDVFDFFGRRKGIDISCWVVSLLGMLLKRLS